MLKKRSLKSFLFLLIVIMIAAVICGCNRKEQPDVTEPAATTGGVVTTEPITTDAPDNTNVPEGTSAPVTTVASVGTTASVAPVTTAKPVVTAKPTTDRIYFPITKAPVATTAPAGSDSPVEPEEPKDPVIIVGEIASAMSGNELVIALDFNFNPGIAYLSLTPEFETDILEWIGYERGVLFAGDGELAVGENFIFSADENVTANGTLAQIKFKVRDNAPAGVYEVSFTVNECYNADLEDVEISVTAGKVTIVVEASEGGEPEGGEPEGGEPEGGEPEGGETEGGETEGGETEGGETEGGEPEGGETEGGGNEGGESEDSEA